MTSRILIVEDDSDFASQWERLMTDFFVIHQKLEHKEFIIEVATGSTTYQKAFDMIADGGNYDLVLLDHHLEPDNHGFTGIDLIKDLHEELGENVLLNRFVMLSALYDLDVSSQYTRFGSLAYLRKPIDREQFFITISDTWLKLQLGIARAEWERADEAIQYLITEGLLEPIEIIAQQVAQQSKRAEALQQLNENLLKKLAEIGDRPEMFRAYKEWDEGVKRIAPTSVSCIYPELQRYKVTKPFLKDLNYFFTTNPRIFVQLHADLAKIRKLGDAARVGRHLFDNHWEYRIGISYRLYFRSEGQDKVLERFDHHNAQDRILDYLRNNTPATVEDYVDTSE